VGVGVGVVPDVGVAVALGLVTVSIAGVLLMSMFWPSCEADAAVATLKDIL